MANAYQPDMEGRRANLDRLMKGTADSVATCDSCGGTYFYSVNAEQFSQGYSSVEYNALASNPRATKICLCGTPLPTKAAARGPSAVRGAQEEYFRSLNASRSYIQTNAISNLAKSAATPKEVEDVKKLLLDKIAELSKAIEELSSKKKTHGTKDQATD